MGFFAALIIVALVSSVRLPTSYMAARPVSSLATFGKPLGVGDFSKVSGVDAAPLDNGGATSGFVPLLNLFDSTVKSVAALAAVVVAPVLPVATAVSLAAKLAFRIVAKPLTTDFFPANNPSKLEHLGRIVVIGAGRPLGSAIVALLASRIPLSVRTIDDGRTGLITVSDFRVPLDEANVTAVGQLHRLLSPSGPSGGADTVFLDMDPLLPVDTVPKNTIGLTLACALRAPALNLKRVIFLTGDAPSLAEALGACAEVGDSVGQSVGEGVGVGSIGLMDWGSAGRFVGPGIDPIALNASSTDNDALNKALLCLATSADALPYDVHNFELNKLLDIFFEASTGTGADACTALIPAAVTLASTNGRLTANAAGDALDAAILAMGDNNAVLGVPLTLFVFSRTEALGAALSPREDALVEGQIRNNLPSLRTFSDADAYAKLKDAVSGILSLAPVLVLTNVSASADAFIDVAWWVWRQGLTHGFRDPEPLPIYDPSTLVSTMRYSIHDINTFGVSHVSNHVKMRYSQTVWGWRFKRGGIPWSSNKPDFIVAVQPIDAPQGSDYPNLALRTVPIWKWAVNAYPRHSWNVRMWDDVFPVVERYVDIASAHDGAGKLAVGRVIGERQAYLSGGPPGLFSSGWADIMRRGADTCGALFEQWKFSTGNLSKLADKAGRGQQVHNARLQQRRVETHCDLGCEDLVIEWCLRDVVGGYYELVHWWGLDSLSPTTINEKGLYECKAMACRRRIIARGDPNDHNPIHMVVFHYVKPWEMVKVEAELYGGPLAGSSAWVDMCEEAQARPECQDELIAM